MSRDDLEKIALYEISAENYYDLADNLDTLDDNELLDLINCNGDYKKELKLAEMVKG